MGGTWPQTHARVNPAIIDRKPATPLGCINLLQPCESFR